MAKHILLALLLAISTASAYAIDMSVVRFKDEAHDTTFINNLLIDVAAKRHAKQSDIIADIAMRFIDTPYVGHTLEGSPEMLTVNIDELDCTTFVETVLALAMTINERRSSWRDFVYNLERVRYRNGSINGYPSRLHYNSDWLMDNAHRGILADATPDFPKLNYVIKTLDFMSSNADKYEALKDSANLEAIKNVEIGYRGYRIAYIKSMDLANKLVKSSFRTGDVLALVSNIKNLDVAHLGFVIVEDGEPYILHASSSAGKVVKSKVPLADFMKRNRQFLGVRVIRLKN